MSERTTTATAAVAGDVRKRERGSEEVMPDARRRRADWEVDSDGDDDDDDDHHPTGEKLGTEESEEDDSWMDFGLEEVAGEPEVAAATANQKRAREVPVRVMPPARWTTLQVASGKYGCNQGGALSMLMENHAHLLQLAFVSSLSFAGDVHEMEAAGAPAAEIKAKRDLVVPWHRYHAHFSAAADREEGGELGQEGKLADALDDIWGEGGGGGGGGGAAEM
jgi:hypothetical protein